MQKAFSSVLGVGVQCCQLDQIVIIPLFLPHCAAARYLSDLACRLRRLPSATPPRLGQGRRGWGTVGAMGGIDGGRKRGRKEVGEDRGRGAGRKMECEGRREGVRESPGRVTVLLQE